MKYNKKINYPQIFTQVNFQFCGKVALKKLVVSLFAVQLFFWPVALQAEHAKHFIEAKKAARIIWKEHPYTFYCGCKFDAHLSINLASCGYLENDNPQAKRVGWEHIVPASWLGRQRPCWREPLCEKKNGEKYKGRQCCERIDPVFRKAYTDLYNLVPAIAEVNSARRNYRFADRNINLDEQGFNGCKVHINSKERIVVPPSDTKGMIARAYLYMNEEYSFYLSHFQEKMYKAWDKQYPPSEWEIKWAGLVHEQQGNENRFITKHLFYE